MNFNYEFICRQKDQTVDEITKAMSEVEKDWDSSDSFFLISFDNTRKLLFHTNDEECDMVFTEILSYQQSTPEVLSDDEMRKKMLVRDGRTIYGSRFQANRFRKGVLDILSK